MKAVALVLACLLRSPAWSVAAVLGLAAGCSAGRSDGEGRVELVWGQRGVQGGKLVKPRAIAIDSADRLFLVDMTARMQVFDRDGKFLGHSWHTPDYRNGRPSGLSIDRDGNLLVSDSHYNCLRVYSWDGKLLRTLGGESGSASGQLSYVSDAIQDRDGCYYVAEFGENQRISKFDGDFKFVTSWGSPGSEPGQFAHPCPRPGARRQPLRRGCLQPSHSGLHHLGGAGAPLGDCRQRARATILPLRSCVCAGPDHHLYVMEYANHRVQKFTLEGKSLGCWGGPGRERGRLCSPWALAVDSRGRVHVIDSENDRVQRIEF